MWLGSHGARWCWMIVVAGLAACSGASTEEQSPDSPESSAGGSAEPLGAGGSGPNENDAAKPGEGGSAPGIGGTTIVGADDAGRPVGDAAVPLFEPGPDDPIPPDPGVTMPFVHSLFTDHMVLQRDAMTPVWGY